MDFFLELLRKLPLKKLGAAAGVAVALIAVIAIGYRMRWWQTLARTLGVWFWLALVLLVVGAIVVALLWFVPRKREKRFLAELHAEDEEQSAPDVRERHAALQKRMQEAVRTLRNSPELRKKEGLPLYALPWYMLMGAGEAGKTSVLRSVAKGFTPFERPEEPASGPTQDCEWWFFNTAVILDTPHTYAFPLEREDEGSQWYRLLLLLRHYREIQPINGLIITLPADACVTHREEELRQEAVQLRRRIDEAIEKLGIDFPVYVLVTRCDILEGFTEFCQQLPEHMTRQVFGFVRQERPSSNGQQPPSSSAESFATHFHAITERLHQLRLSIYDQEHLPTTALRQKVFCFPEEFQALQRPLGIFLETLFQVNPVRPTPFFRGLFFCSAVQQGQTQSFLRAAFHVNGHESARPQGDNAYFLHDLFTLMLPRDQSLVRATGKASRSRRLRHLLGLGGCLGLCGVVLLALTHAFVSDRRVYASVKADECPLVKSDAAGPFDLQHAALCRSIILGLEQRNRQRFQWSRVVFNRSGKRLQRLRQEYVQRYAAEVLSPLDGKLEQQLRSGSDAIPVVFLLINRIELAQHCLGERGCPGVVPDERSPDYQLMLAVTGERAPPPEHVTTVQHTYHTYLHWAALTTQEVLKKERADHASRLQQWFATNKFAPEQILHWANQQYDPVTLRDVWTDLPTQATVAPVQVDGGYTRDAWQQSLRPFLMRAEAAVPSMQQALHTFRAAYRTDYFAQWHQFLVKFPSGEFPWWDTAEQRRTLMQYLLQPTSPYNRVFDLTLEHLTPHLPDDLLQQATPQKTADNATALPGQPSTDGAGTTRGGKTDDTEPVPLWVEVLVRYNGSATRRTYQDTFLQLRDALADDPLREKRFKLAHAGFQEEAPPAGEPQHPILKLAWLVQEFRKQEATADTSVQALWPLLERPLLFVWKVVLEDTGVFFQKRWAENVLAPATDLAELERINFLYGPEGKVRAFVDEFLRPFLADNETRPRQILDESIPLSSAFLTTLQNAKQLPSVLESGKQTPQRVSVEVTRQTAIESQTNIIADRVQFVLECATKTFKVAMPSQENATPAATVFWTFEGCGDVLVTTTVSCNRQCVERAAAVGMSVPEISRLRLRKRYKGQEGFFQFVDDFRDGSQAFGLREFADSYAMSEWQDLQSTLRPYGLSAIRMYFRVEVSPALERLIALKPDDLVATRIVE